VYGIQSAIRVSIIGNIFKLLLAELEHTGAYVDYAFIRLKLIVVIDELTVQAIKGVLQAMIRWPGMNEMNLADRIIFEE
jgi:hypothetical protein